jgi:hypothetical protein
MIARTPVRVGLPTGIADPPNGTQLALVDGIHATAVWSL